MISEKRLLLRQLKSLLNKNTSTWMQTTRSYSLLAVSRSTWYNTDVFEKHGHWDGDTEQRLHVRHSFKCLKHTHTHTETHTLTLTHTHVFHLFSLIIDQPSCQVVWASLRENTVSQWDFKHNVSLCASLWAMKTEMNQNVSEAVSQISITWEIILRLYLWDLFSLQMSWYHVK